MFGDGALRARMWLRAAGLRFCILNGRPFGFDFLCHIY
jgi:hypothetical protein